MKISKEGYQKLYNRYKEIDEQIIEVQRQMGESAKRDNDLRENPEYMSLRVKAMYTLPQERRTLYEQYNNAVIIEETDEYKTFDGKTVIVGSEVKLIIDGEEEVYKILGDNEGDVENSILSCNALLAQKILNKHVGEEVLVNDMKINILSVTRI